MRGQEKVTKEKATPRTRPEHIPVLRMRERPPGFAEGTSLCLRRTGPHPAGHPSDFSVVRSPCSRGPTERASCARGGAKRMAVACFERGQDGRHRSKAFLGPLCCGEGQTIRPAGWAQRIAPTCRRARDGASASPAGPNELFVHGWTKSAAPGWPFFGPPFFGHAKKGGSPAREAGEKRQGCHSLVSA